jgi:8-oxo-dGTP pyrophosphatase MutT (NUDIX family)
MAYPPFIQFLDHRLNKPLPGIRAQLKMAPKPSAGKTSKRQMTPPLNAQKSGVLALLHPAPLSNTSTTNSIVELDDICIVITHRSEDIDHSGQLSFPGGKSGPHETAVETAKREAFEEIGIKPNLVHTLGKLSGLYIQNSNNFVHPVVGWIDHYPNFTINPAEVQEAFSIPLIDLISDNFRKREYWTIRNYRLHVPFWDIHNVPLWGATAMMVSELVHLCKEYLEKADEVTVG